MDLRSRHSLHFFLAVRCALPLVAPLALVCAVSLFAGCSTTPTLALSAAPLTIGGDGQSPITLKASVTRGGSPVDGASVHFTASLGSFAGAEPSTPGVADVISVSGDATVVLTAPRRGRGNIDVVASASIDGTSVTASATVALTPAGGKADRLEFSCGSQNVGGLVTGRIESIHVLCTAKAFIGTKELVNPSIEAYAEAGSLEWQKDDTGKQQLIYTVEPGARGPIDVDPFDSAGKPRELCPTACAFDPAACDGEPCWIDNGTTRNPRDGLATLMVAVPAVAGFFDQSSFGEPFVDANDDGVRQATEPFIDVNGNGKYDDANGPSGGVKQDPRMLWKSLRIVWSGSADTSNTAHGSNAEGTPQKKDLTNGVLRVHDRNYNKLAANGPAGTDLATLAATCTQSATFTPSPQAPMALDQLKPGVQLNNGDQEHPIAGPGFPTSYRQGTEYPIGGSVDSAAAKPVCTISATLNRVFDPGAPGFSTTGSSDAETVIGKPLQF